ncbi:two-component system response regulator, partial [Streptomyces scabiei]|nr:two-component system response regulator [Streptomyces scabiei]
RALHKVYSVEGSERMEGPCGVSDRRFSPTVCASRPGIALVSARRYLEYFHGTGSADVSLRYGVAGRPERRYSWRV